MTFDAPLSGAAATDSIGALPPPATASNAVVRTVRTFKESFDCTVAKALPA